MTENYIEWRWVDDKGRAMTNWRLGDTPCPITLYDDKGAMAVEVRVVEVDTEHS